MLTIPAPTTIRGSAGANTSIDYHIVGLDNAVPFIAQGTLTTSTATLHTATGTGSHISKILLANTTAGAVVATLLILTKQLVSVTIPIGGACTIGDDGWKVTDANGAVVAVGTVTLTGDVTGSGVGSVATTLANDAVTNAKLANMASATFKGQTSGGSGDPVDLTAAQAKTALAIANTDVSGLGTLSTQNGTFSGTHSGASSGTNTGDQTITLSSDVTGSGVGAITTTLKNTGPGATGPLGSASVAPIVTIDAQGRVTALSSATITPAAIAAVPTIRTVSTTAPLTGGGALSGDLTLVLTTSPAGQTPVGTTRTITATTPLLIDGTTSADLSANRTLSIPAATTSVNGYLTSVDKTKLDNAWIDVTANTTALVLPGNSAAANITAINAILSAAPNGSTIKFPKGRYDFNAAWTMPSKMFTFVGEGSNRAGSPATAFTELRWTSDVVGTWITLAGSGNAWYTEFKNLVFTSSVAQTAGYVVDANGNVGVNFRDCGFQGNGGTLFGVLNYGGGNGSNSANSTVVDNCHMSSFKDVGIRVNASGSSLVVSNCVIQGLWGAAASSQAANACISGGFVGALQINDCDILGAVNNLLLNPVFANGEVCASVFCTNTYMDNSFGSCVKITGTGGTVRCRFDTCSFTTSGPASGGVLTGLTAVEIASTFAYAAGGQGIDFVNCNVLNTFGTTGTTNGFLISETADFSIGNCRIAGWTNGVQVTPDGTAGVTQCQINNNTIGPAGGFAGNSVGILLNAGAAAYGALIIESNHLSGNTTSPITDNSLATGATITHKSINGNTGYTPGIGGIVSLGAIVTTNVEISVARIPIPANSLKVGSAFRFQILCSPLLASIITTRARFGTAGTVADAAVIITSADPAAGTAAALHIVSGIVIIQAIGAAATTARGSGTTTHLAAATATGNAAITAAFSSTVANFLTISMQNTTSTTTTVYGGYLEGCA